MKKQGIELITKVTERLTKLAEGYDIDDSEQAGMHLALVSMADMLEAAKAMVAEQEVR